MRFCVLVSAFCLLTAPVAQGQWIETTIPLPDSFSGLSGLTTMVYHAPTHSI
jgi:hypothetical protein